MNEHQDPPPSPVDVATTSPSSDDAPGWAAPDGKLPVAPAPSGDPLLSGPMPPLPVELNPDEERIRSVQAISSRIDVDIRMGPSRQHRLLTLGLPAVAAVLVAVTGLIAYRNPPAGSSSADLGADVVGDAALAFTEDDGSTVDSERLAASVSASLVPITVAGCGPVGEHVGILVAPNRVIAPASVAVNDVNPIITFPDGSTRLGTVIGIDGARELSVIELDGAASVTDRSGVATPVPSIAWGSTDQLYTDAQVIVVEGHGAAATGTALSSTAIDGIVGKVAGFDLEQGGFAPGSAVLNRRGLLVGVVDASGARAIGGAELQQAIGRLTASRPMATATCPVVEDVPVTEAEG